MKSPERMGRRLARTRWGRKALEDPPDLGVFRQRHRPRLVLGLALIAISYVICWPVIAAIGVVAVYLNRPLILAVAAPLIWGFSHLVWMGGMFLTGVEGGRHLGLLLRWGTGRLLARMIGQGSISPAAESRTSASTSLSRKE